MHCGSMNKLWKTQDDRSYIFQTVYYYNNFSLNSENNCSALEVISLCSVAYRAKLWYHYSKIIVWLTIGLFENDFLSFIYWYWSEITCIYFLVPGITGFILQGIRHLRLAVHVVSFLSLLFPCLIVLTIMFKWQKHRQKEITVQYTEGAVTSFSLNLIYRTVSHPLNNTGNFVLPGRMEFSRPTSLRSVADKHVITWLKHNSSDTTIIVFFSFCRATLAIFRGNLICC